MFSIASCILYVAISPDHRFQPSKLACFLTMPFYGCSAIGNALTRSGKYMIKQMSIGASDFWGGNISFSFKETSQVGKYILKVNLSGVEISSPETVQVITFDVLPASATYIGTIQAVMRSTIVQEKVTNQNTLPVPIWGTNPFTGGPVIVGTLPVPIGSSTEVRNREIITFDTWQIQSEFEAARELLNALYPIAEPVKKIAVVCAGEECFAQ